MAKIKVRVKPGQVLEYYEGNEIKEYIAGDVVVMEEEDAKPILGSCITKIGIVRTPSKPTAKKPLDEKKTV